MSKKIPQSFIDEIVSRTDIVELVGRRVTLKQAGGNFKGLCPFHDEKTASFIVTPSRGTYHCFGCGVHGTAISFLMEYENLSFPESVETLAEALGIDMPDVEVANESNLASELTGILSEADRIYRSELRANPVAIDYLRSRGIDGPTAARFGIGFAPDAWDTLKKRLGTHASRIEQLVTAGLLIRHESGRHYDRFRNRIMFPIRNPRGQVIGFGGRVMGDGEPKYLNSPETPVFHKGLALYGLYEAREFKLRPERLLVVEGYLDVASLTQHDIGPAVATLGTATTAEHIRRLTRLTNCVVFCFDGDVAGRKAAWRALEIALPFAGAAIELKFLILPEGHDPDSLVRTDGGQTFESLLRDAQPLSRFFIGELKRQHDLSTSDGRARLLAAARPLLAGLSDVLYRELLVVELSNAIGLSAEQISASFGSPASPKAARGKHRPAIGTDKPTVLRKAIALVLHYPKIAAEVESVEGFDELELPGARLLRDLLNVAHQRPEITSAHLIEHFRDDPDGRYLSRIAGDVPLDDAAAAAAVLRDSMARVVADQRRRRTAAQIRQVRAP